MLTERDEGTPPGLGWPLAGHGQQRLDQTQSQSGSDCLLQSAAAAVMQPDALVRPGHSEGVQVAILLMPTPRGGPSYPSPHIPTLNDLERPSRRLAPKGSFTTLVACASMARTFFVGELRDASARPKLHSSDSGCACQEATGNAYVWQVAAGHAVHLPELTRWACAEWQRQKPAGPC